MSIKRFNIVRPKNYEKNGEKKTQWLQVGTIVQFDDGGLGIELNHSSEKLCVFEQKPKEGYQQVKTIQQPTQDEEIRAEDLPY